MLFLRNLKYKVNMFCSSDENFFDVIPSLC